VFNVWWLRPGVVKVHDGDPDAVGPAAAITTGELTPYRDDTVTVEGCVDALEGTTYTVSYAVVTEDIQWVEYESGLPVGGDSFAFEFSPPEPLHGESGILKVDFVDPENRTYTSFMNENIITINADNPSGCNSDGGSFIGCPGDSGGSDESAGSDDDVGESGNLDAGATEDESGTEESDDGDPDLDDDGGTDPKGCACTTTTERGAAPLLVIVGALVLRRRRRAA
jgi:MYXO-CTERM domain-containing protein